MRRLIQSKKIAGEFIFRFLLHFTTPICLYYYHIDKIPYQNELVFAKVTGSKN